MIGKGLTIGRSVVELQDLVLDYLENNSGDVNNKTGEKIIRLNFMAIEIDNCALNACCWETRTEN